MTGNDSYSTRYMAYRDEQSRHSGAGTIRRSTSTSTRPQCLSYQRATSGIEVQEPATLSTLAVWPIPWRYYGLSGDARYLVALVELL